SICGGARRDQPAEKNCSDLEERTLRRRRNMGGWRVGRQDQTRRFVAGTLALARPRATIALVRSAATVALVLVGATLGSAQWKPLGQPKGPEKAAPSKPAPLSEDQ